MIYITNKQHFAGYKQIVQNSNTVGFSRRFQHFAGYNVLIYIVNTAWERMFSGLNFLARDTHIILLIW